MFGEIFYWVLNMSITAALVGSVVLLLRLIKRIPRRIVFFLWIIPFIRMAVPLGIGSRYGIMPLISKFTARTVVVYGSPDTADVTMTNCVMAAESYFPLTYTSYILEKVFGIAGVIWIVISAALIIAFFMLYFTALHELKNSEHFQGNIYFSDKLDTPAVYGVFCPRIILPVSCKELDINLILLHEKAHIQRCDNFRRALAFITAAVHWFNPLSWAFLKCFLTDMELSCDEKVLSKCSEKQKKEYAGILLDCAESRNVFVCAFGGAKIRIRIKNILSYRKMSAFSAVCLTLMTTVITFMLLTNPQ